MTTFVGPSIWRQWNVRSATATFAAISENPTGERVIFAPIWNDALIGRSRSIMVSEFLKTDADVMVVIDDDIVFEPADFWKIIEGARHTRSVYGGAYVTRSTTPHLSSRKFPDTALTFAQGPSRRPAEIIYLATGFWAMHRDLVESMVDAEYQTAYGPAKMEQCQQGADRLFYPFFAPFTVREDNGDLHYLSEDWAFCNRARQLGHKIWCDQSIILQHMGDYPYTVADLKITEPGLPSTGIDAWQSAYGPKMVEDPLIDNVIDDIAEFTGDEPGDVRRMSEGDTTAMALNKLWLTRREDEEDWYRREDVGLHYLVDLAGWHRRGGLPYNHLDVVPGKSVMDFGAGIGAFSLAAAREGARVWAVEINPVMRDFIRFRATKYGIELAGVVETMDDVPAGEFDVITAWHVYEHLEHPEQVLRCHVARLKPGGVLISDSGFDDPSTAQHHVRTDWADVLKRNGFVQLAPERYELVCVREAVLA